MNQTKAVNRIRKMVSFELGKEIEKDIFVLSQAQDKEKTLTPKKEWNLRPSDSLGSKPPAFRDCKYMKLT